MDELNDMIDTARLSIFIRISFDDFSIKEGFFKVVSLTRTARGEDMHKEFKQFKVKEEIPIKN